MASRRLTLTWSPRSQPVIRVGNILGTRTDDSDGLNAMVLPTVCIIIGQDQIVRGFRLLTPDVVYEGETDKTFKIVYAANGPMYSILTIR